MPQTNLAGYAPPSETYNVYADYFDLSLLPITDNALPAGPHCQQLTLDLPPSAPTNYIPTTIFQDYQIKSETTDEYYSSDLLMVPNHTTQPQPYTSTFYPVPNQSPHQDQFVTVFPPSPAPSHDSQTTTIKQEFSSTFYPPSPPDSHGSLSPRCNFDYFKNELCETSASSDSESCIDIDSLLIETEFSAGALDSGDQTGQLDHQLLRGHLQDTSFQRKHNLKPLALESLLMGGWASGDDIGPVISLALEHARKDVQQTCAALNIPSGECEGQIRNT